MDYWQWIAENIEDGDIDKVVIVMWCIWNTRNKRNSDQLYPNQNLHQSIFQIQELIREQLEGFTSRSKLSSPKNTGSHPSHEEWANSNPNTWKLNMGVAWFDKDGVGGIGWVLRGSARIPDKL